MTGKNTLELNQATINEAIEFYLNERVFKEPVRVQTVTQKNAHNVTFTVELREPEDREA